ncbi:Potassium channel tetramerisation-type BTB domain and BTB/POZ fold domain-containing protein [Strongyloides ratti]|uniref:Potassium channel tetramerisation-type BTB domain and BTB/POZ fold domain-containing protein n=1 Tax=Strongyloides ratti TaxID=34506 RepID=A0A090KPL5_STRRB|nr:Potassium channel tetramerisation-type BTB domain and BTB/POZ fold domain-containing protein [Strongyloides ratti]CEF59309.1 Potassium channel tetramerisation-type BTB domain and BTB/POZ fold domain-containing protein [Strongyloides ratti]
MIKFLGSRMSQLKPIKMNEDIPIQLNIGGTYFYVSRETINRIPLIAEKYYQKKATENTYRRFSTVGLRHKITETINSFKNSSIEYQNGSNSSNISGNFISDYGNERQPKHSFCCTNIFIDRDSKYFPIILEFARNTDEAFETRFHFDEDEDLIALEKECKFYQMDDFLQIIQMLMEPLKINNTVTWKQSAIDSYWRTFVNCVVDPSLTLPFLFEKNSHLLAKCIACDTVQEPKLSSIINVNSEGWLPLIHHMRSMKGIIIQTIDETCCVVEWQNGIQTHLPNSCLKRLLDPVTFSSGSTTPEN